MSKESSNFHDLQQRREHLSHILDQRKSLIDRIGTGSVKVGSSFENTLKVGETRRAVRESIARIGDKIEQINAGLTSHTLAESYLENLEKRRDQLAQISEMVSDGVIPADVLRKHQIEFEELIALPATDSALKKVIDQLNQEKETPKPVKKEADHLILGAGEARVISSLIELRGHTQILLPNGESATFQPGWIMQEINRLGFPFQGTRIKPEELITAREGVLRKAEEIIESSEKDPMAIQRQQEPIGFLLAWIAAGGEISTPTQEMTTRGLINFLLSPMALTTQRDKQLTVLSATQTYEAKVHDFKPKNSLRRTEAGLPPTLSPVAGYTNRGGSRDNNMFL